jgi:hypothetical protein
MAGGMIPARGPIVAAPANSDQGIIDWQLMSGIDAVSPMVGGRFVEGLQPTDVDRGRSVIVSLPNAGASATGAGAGQSGVHLLDDWRDLFNLSGSPMPWLLLLTLAMLGFAQFAVSARVGPGRAAAGVG